MAGEITIPAKDPNDGTSWETGDTVVKAGVTFTRQSNGTWKAPVSVTLTRDSEGNFTGKLTPEQQKAPSTGGSSTASTADGEALTPAQIEAKLRDEALIVSSSNTGLPEGMATSSSYDLTTQPRYILTTMEPRKREEILRELYLRGGYQGQKRGNGISNSDISAFQDYLNYANIMGVDYEKALYLYKDQNPVNPYLQAGGGGGGRKAPRQVTNPADLKAVFKKASQDLLGRAIDDNVAEQFVQSFQNQQLQQQTQLETQSGGVVAQAPDAGVAAEKMIERRFGEEVRVQNAANLGNIMDKMIKGLAR
ncbi:hypothetical protein UFOVP668_26 [uncultured Caudovirales phage]|uniref:Uncharacterized protein n=1 Tax=uncultured Caudovirales phage TaxID=2100421 RepID=A0A6J5NEI3_9CAUD|nr:hypothetical protein UFOVP668_26 [uncultured Caudovirales phage]